MSRQEREVLIHQVYHDLKELISSGTLKPGEKLYQQRIADMLGVSRTPLLKAFHILEQEMYLESIPGRGMYVRSVNMNDILSTFECRQGIETTAVRILTSVITEEELNKLYSFFEPFLNSKNIDLKLYLEADSDFHFSIVQMSRNDYLIRMNKLANIQKMTYRQGLIRDPSETLPEHLKIISALETRDTGLAEEYMRNHIRKSIIAIRERIFAEAE